jgi:hypothetical protein
VSIQGMSGGYAPPFRYASCMAQISSVYVEVLSINNNQHKVITPMIIET